MPKFFKKDLFSNPQNANIDPTHELPSALDTPELPPPYHPNDYLAPPPETYWGYDPYADYLFDPVHVLLSWKAPSRPHRKKDRSYYTTVIIILALVSLIAFFLGERLLIGVFLALLFLIYVLNFTPPEEIEYKISNQGITIGEHFYHWQELDSFWFSEKDGFKILNIVTLFRFPGLLIIVLGDQNQEEVKKIVARFLPFHEIAPKTQFEKWAEKLQKHFPLENPHK